MSERSYVSIKLKDWEGYVTNYHLPEWDAIPNIGLYMDQVIVLLNQYLTFVPSENDPFVTPSAINNYVRLKVMPAPQRRKYFREHIVYLILIITLKQSISINAIQQMIPADLSAEALQSTYEGFTNSFRHLSTLVYNQVKDLCADNPEQETSPARIATECALMSGFTHILSTKIMNLGAPAQAEDASAKPKTGKRKSTSEE